jgi:hypothetical protein
MMFYTLHRAAVLERLRIASLHTCNSLTKYMLPARMHAKTRNEAERPYQHDYINNTLPTSTIENAHTMSKISSQTSSISGGECPWSMSKSRTCLQVRESLVSVQLLVPALTGVMRNSMSILADCVLIVCTREFARIKVSQ